MEPQIIFEDDDLLIVNKPSGVITNDADTTGDNPTLQTWLRNNFSYETSGSSEYRSGVVHRLDKETSGVIIIAKTKDSFNFLQSQFKERKVSKTYLGLAHGWPKEEVGVVDAPVGRLPWRRDRFGVLSGGRDANTSYKVVKKYKKGSDGFSLIEFSPKTGRTHQIRIHAKYLGHPLVADSFYAGRKTSRRDRIWCPRTFLHAASIAFSHPTGGARVEYKADLPGDLKLALESLTPST